ncbi:hypothetical protein C8J56DRAFT_1049728 [Mycena floridula]|nr:hypothetical protein C8J56DRAFT_1049728 [Mycena floridula]
MSTESAPQSAPTLYRLETDATEIVVGINAVGMQSLQMSCPTARYFTIQVRPARHSGELLLGRARPFDLGSTSDMVRWNMVQGLPALPFKAPPDGWYAVKVGFVPGVYRGWNNAVCSALAGASEEDTECKFFPLRDDAIEQFAQWAAAKELIILHRDGTYRATLGSYIDLDKVQDDAEKEDISAESPVLGSIVAL